MDSRGIFRDFKKPKSLSINDVSILHNTWCGVTRKQDGLLVAMVCTDKNHDECDDSNVSVYQQNGEFVERLKCHSPFKEIVYAEYIDKERYVLFECNLKMNLRRRVSFLQSLQFQGGAVSVNPYIFTRQPFDYLTMEGDGVVITSVYNYRLPIFKYKSCNTVDFYIKDNQCYCMISRQQYNQLDETWRDDSDQPSGSYFPFRFKLQSRFEPTGEVTIDDVVAECYLNIEANVWKCFRLRPDKTLEFQKSKTGPNNWDTCLVHYHLFHKPLTIEYIREFLKTKQE